MFYIFHGEDTFAQQETLSDLLSKVGDPAMLELNTTHFDGIMPFAALRQACDVVPFLAKRRIIFARGLLAAKPSADFMDKLCAYLPTMPDSALLFFLESSRLPPKTRLIQLAEKLENGFVRLFERPTGSALNRWIQQHAHALGGDISPRATHVLATNVGNDLAVLNMEISKLVMYRANNGSISAEDVLLLSPYAAEASIFDLVDAIGNRNARQAARLLQQQLNEGVDPFQLFAMMVRQFRLLIQVKEVAQSGARPVEIAKTLKQHPFVVGKLYQQSHGFSLEQLEQIHAHLLDIDVSVKTGRADMNTALHLFLAALTEPV